MATTLPDRPPGGRFAFRAAAGRPLGGLELYSVSSRCSCGLSSIELDGGRPKVVKSELTNMVWTVVPPKFQGDISLIRSSDGSLLAFEKSADVVRFEGTADETYTFVPSPVP